MQDLNDKITGNELTAAEWNEVPSEIQAIIVASGQTLSSGTLNQALKALRITFDTVAAMKLVSLPAGLEVTTKGYTTAGDGGGATYLIKAPQAFDGYGDHELANSNIAVLQIDGAINTKQYGVKGGGADDTLAIQAALDSSTDVSLEFEGGDIYVITSTLTFIGKDKLSIRSNNGNKFKFSLSTAIECFDFQGTADVATTTLAADASSNEKTITVTSAAGAVEGQLVELYSSASWHYDPRPATADTRKGELHLVTKVDGTTIWLDSVVCDSYVIASETVDVFFHTPLEIHLQDFIVEYPKNTSIRSGIGGDYLANSSIKNIEDYNSGISGMGASYTKNLLIENCYIQGVNVLGTGYGMSFGMSSDVVARNCTFVECRAGADFTGTIPTRFCLVDGCTIHGGGLDSLGADMFASGLQRGLGTHGGSEHIKFTNNQISRVWIGIASRGASCIIQNNKFIGEMKSCVNISYGEDVVIEGNTHNLTESRITAMQNEIPDYFVSIEDNAEPDGRFDISNNITAVAYAFIEIDSTTSAFTHLYVNNNRCIVYGATATPSFIEGNYSTSGNSSFTTYSNIRDNPVTVLNGTFRQYRDTGTAADARYTRGLDAFLFDDPLKLVAVSGGSLSARTVNLTTSLNDGVVTVVGKIKFDVLTAPTVIRLDDLPPTEEIAVLNMRYYDGAAYQQGTVYINTLGELRIGSTTASASAAFAVGADQVIYLDISYNSPY